MEEKNNQNISYEEAIKILEENLKHVDKEYEWDTLSGKSMPFNVGEKKGFMFEIRTEEPEYHIPHFHVKKSEYTGSYSITSLEKLAGNFKSKQEKIIINWAKEYNPLLVQKWNQVHPKRQISIV